MTGEDGTQDFPRWRSALSALPATHLRGAATQLVLQPTLTVEQRWRVVETCAFDCEQAQLCGSAAGRGEAAGLAAGRDHAMARNNDGDRVLPQRFADAAGVGGAEFFGDGA